MEALVMFDPQNFPIITHFNDQFISDLTDLAIKLKLVEMNEDRENIILKSHEINDLISLIFSPFIASIRVLNGKSSFIGNLLSEHVKNLRITYDEFMDHFLIYISNTESSRNLQRDELKLDYMLEIIKLVFGSNPSSMRFNENGKELVIKMYETWLRLRDEPRYLFESTEKLIISPQLRTNFTLVLQQVLSTIKNYSSNWNENIIHALVLLEGKLVSQFHCKCSRGIDKKSLLMIQLLMDSQTVSDGEFDENGFMSCQIESSLQFSCCEERVNYCEEFVIFLEPICHPTSMDQSYLVPIILRIITIKNGLKLIFLSDSVKEQLASSVSCLLQIFNCVLYKRNDLKGFIEVKKFNQSFLLLKKFFDLTKSKLLGQVVKKLNLITNQDFKRFLVDINFRELPSSMDALLSSTCSSLRTLYHQEIFSSELARLSLISRNKKIIKQLRFIRKIFLSNISVFIDYLFVKSMRNMTIDPYTASIPGIINFVFIDRRHNLLVHTLPPNHDLSLFMAKSRQSLISGNLNYKWTHNHRIYEYFLWFEDFKGNSSNPARNDFTLKSYPSIVGEDFIKEITSKCYPHETFYSLSNCTSRSNPSIFEFFLVRESRSVSKSDQNDLNLTFLQIKRMSHQLRENVSPELLPNFL